MTSTAGDLAYAQIVPLLRRLGGMDLVLVGGQAVNFWAERYLGRVAEIGAGLPYTSKDIDFCGDRQATAECAQRLGGKALFPDLDDATPNAGMVVLAELDTKEIDLAQGSQGDENRRVADDDHGRSRIAAASASSSSTP
ncbi:MAG: hypothetical protein HY744_29720 [Deltaproteobacteria bacterium]|nr:hypothetical protein [Deltaproteobacteria bacterium]